MVRKFSFQNGKWTLDFEKTEGLTDRKCFGSQDSECCSPIDTSFYTHLGRQDGAEVELCCVKKLGVRAEDLRHCASTLTSFRICKGQIKELAFETFAHCNKLHSFVVKTYDINKKRRFIFRNGFPRMPCSLQELMLEGAVDEDANPICLWDALSDVTALKTLNLQSVSFRTTFDFIPCYTALKTFTFTDCTTNISPSFWNGCVNLEVVHITGATSRGIPAAKVLDTNIFTFFGHILSLGTINMPAKLREVTFENIPIPELPESIGRCVDLVSLTVTSCGLKTLPSTLPNMINLENLSVCRNNLYLEGVRVLTSCDYWSNPVNPFHQRGSRAISLAGNKLPTGTPECVTIIAHLQALPKEDVGLFMYDYHTLQQATGNFSPESLINTEGSFGPVFKGNVGASMTNHIAIKVMRDKTLENAEQFRAELRALQQCRHPNLIQLLGCCMEDEYPRCIVYEFKGGGSLREVLDATFVGDTGASGETSRVRLSWRRRICMLMQLSSVLEYLHTIVQPPIIHRDIKSANILLDGSLNVALGDFGLARVSPEIVAADSSNKNASTRIFGTPGYIDPEYAQTGKVSLASDVYSFGIVALEMLTSRRAYDTNHIPPVLVNAVEEALEDDNVNELFDRTPGTAWPHEMAVKVLSLANKCLKARGSRRPGISDIASEILLFADECACHPMQLLGEGREETAEKGDSSTDTCDESLLCVICITNPSSHVITPCGHMCLCDEHAELLLQRNDPCPVCRMDINSIVKVYH